MARVVVVGSANADVVVAVGRRPEPGETLATASYGLFAGGKGANQAVAASRAGADVCFVGCVGDDPWGEYVKAALVESGVRPLLGDAACAPTGAAFITVTPDGENSIVVATGANARVCNALVDAARDEIESADVLLVQLEVPLEPVERACRMARDAGVYIVLTPAPARAAAIPLLGLADIVVANLGEARALVGPGSTLEVVHRLCAGTPVAAVLTLGAQGAVVAELNGKTTTLPARRFADPIDTTGAGDTLAGVLGARLAAGDDPAKAARAGVIAASLSVTRRGAQASMPEWAEIASELQSRRY